MTIIELLGKEKSTMQRGMARTVFYSTVKHMVITFPQRLDQLHGRDCDNLISDRSLLSVFPEWFLILH